MQNRDAPNFGLRSQHAIAVCFAILMAILSGCASTPEQKVPPQFQLGKVAIVTTFKEPEIKFEGFASGKVEGATRTTGAFIGYCEFMAVPLCLLDPLPGCLIVLACIPLGAAHGVGAAVVSPSSSEVQSAESGFFKVMAVNNIQEALSKQIFASALPKKGNMIPISAESPLNVSPPSDYHSLAADGVQTVLEVNLTNINIEDNRSYFYRSTIYHVFSAPFDLTLHLRMVAHVRLVRTSDNTEIFTTGYVYTGEGPKVSEWATNQYEVMLDALNIGCRNLAEQITSNLLPGSSSSPVKF